MRFEDYKIEIKENVLEEIGKYKVNIMNSEMLLYQDRDGVIKVDVRLEDETVWLKLLRNSVVRKFRTTQKGTIGKVYK